MMPFPSYYGFGRREGFFPGFGGIDMDVGSSSFSSKSTAEAKAASASKSHSEAEKRRRERINGHLDTLRMLLPNATKTDKASLLAEVVHRVKELERQARNVAPVGSTNSSSVTHSGVFSQLPGETDELTLDSDPGSSLIKASVCCDDRPDLLSDLNGALRSLRLRAVKAEIATLGGRTKSVFLIEGKREGDEFLQSVHRTLKSVLEKRVPLGAPGQMMSGNKRLRLSQHLTVGGF